MSSRESGGMGLSEFSKDIQAVFKKHNMESIQGGTIRYDQELDQMQFTQIRFEFFRKGCRGDKK